MSLGAFRFLCVRHTQTQTDDALSCFPGLAGRPLLCGTLQATFPRDAFAQGSGGFKCTWWVTYLRALHGCSFFTFGDRHMSRKSAPTSRVFLVSKCHGRGYVTHHVHSYPPNVAAAGDRPGRAAAGRAAET